MNLVIKKDGLLEKIILLLMLLQIMIVRWMDLSLYFSYIVIALFLVHLFCNYKKYFRMKLTMLSSLIFLAYFWINTVTNGGSKDIGIMNFKMIAPSIFMLLFVSYILRYRIEVVREFVNNSIWFLNLYYIINVPVLLLELNGNIALAGKHPPEAFNTMFEDMISGLLGYNGTPVLALFCAFMTIINMYKLGNMKNSWRKNLYCLYIILISGFMLWISTKNDNKSVILIVFLFVIAYLFFAYNNKINRLHWKKIMNVLKYALIVTVVTFVSYNLLMQIDMFNSIITKIFDRINEGISLGSKAAGSAERIGGVVAILSDIPHRMLGYGLGKYTWRQGNAFGFFHFGQNDLSAFLFIGGMLFVVLLLWLVYVSFNSIRKSMMHSVVLLAIFLILLLYTQVLTEVSSMYIYLYFVILCYLKIETS